MPAVPSFPTDIEIDILSRLPTMSLVRFALACKSWMRLISYIINNRALLGKNTRILLWPIEPRLLYEYLYLRSLNPEALSNKGDYMDATSCVSLPTTTNLKRWYVSTSPTENLDDFPRFQDYKVDIIGSSNGLICFSIDLECASNPTIFWNPLTRIYKKLPPCPLVLKEGGRGALSLYLFNEIDKCRVWGFGYDVSSADFKLLVRVHSRSFKIRQFQVYSLQANTSRVLDRHTFPDSLSETYYSSAPTPLNGALHWLTGKWNFVIPREPQLHNGIVAFDLAGETFRDFPLADGIAMVPGDHKFLAILGGRLCAGYRETHDSAKTEIWVMKEYGVKESWAPWVSVAIGPNFRPIYVSQNKEILGFIDHKLHHHLVTYNPTHKTYRVIRCLWHGRFRGVVYGENFASPSPIGHLELTPAVPGQPQPTSCSSFVTKGPITRHVITEDDLALYAKIDLPGVDRDGLKVRLDNKFIIHIEAKEGGKDPEFDMEGGKETRKYYLRIKLHHWGFKDVKWGLRNGVLKLVVIKVGYAESYLQPIRFCPPEYAGQI